MRTGDYRVLAKIISTMSWKTAYYEGYASPKYFNTFEEAKMYGEELATKGCKYRITDFTQKDKNGNFVNYEGGRCKYKNYKGELNN